jgi:hypothetical protein
MKHRERLSTLYNGYRANGHEIFAVTLSTYVKSEAFARSPRMQEFWSNVFIRRIQKRLPFKYKNKLDYDFIIEQSPDGYFHFHGFLAIPMNVSHYIYVNDSFSRQIARDMDCLGVAGKYRTFRVNKYHIERVGNIEQWATYITKTNNYIH